MRAWVALAALLAVPMAGCDGSVQVERAAAPGGVRSLGLVGAWFDVRGVDHDSTVVAVALQPAETRTYFEQSLRLAWWDPSTQRLEILESRYDRDSRTLSAKATHEGLHAVVGLSRYDRILKAQLQVSAAKNLAHGSDFVWPDCRRVLCTTDTLQLLGEDPAVGVVIPLDDLCEQCTQGPIRPGDFPESGLFEKPTLMMDTRPCEWVLQALDTVDTDLDGLSDMKEICNTHTNATLADTDGDGLEDDWEVNGTTVNGVFVDLPALGVNPLQRDLLVEIDWMVVDIDGDGDTDLEPDASALNKAVQVFAAQNVHLIIHGMNSFSAVDGEAMIREFFVRDGYWLANWADFGYTDFSSMYDTVMAENASPAARAGYSRYCLWVDAYDDEASSGLTEIVDAFDFGMHFIVSLGYFSNTPGGLPHQQLGVFLHELGHTLRLYHSGDNQILATTTNYFWKNFEPNYPSVMNYFHTLQGVTGGVARGWSHHDRSVNYNTPSVCAGTYQGILCFKGPDYSARVFDYSHGASADIDENGLSEAHWTTHFGFASPAKWDRYGTANGAGLWKVNLQYDWIYKWNGGWVADAEQFDAQTDWDDWTRMQFKNW